MPKGEEILVGPLHTTPFQIFVYYTQRRDVTVVCLQSIALGDGWCAAATNRQQVRVFTLGGVQRDLFSVPGPVVCVAAHTHQLLVVYHKSMGRSKIIFCPT